MNTNITTLRSWSVSVIILLLLSGCSDEPEISPREDNFSHLEVDDTFLPVWVRGNTASGTILLYIQGGPGLATIDAATIDFFEWRNTLEEDFAIAYYDQRGVGNKQGRFDLADITMEQYLYDLHQVVRFLKGRYPESRVVLFGHSFGGHLGYRYAIDYGDEHMIDGLISIAGPATHDGKNVHRERWRFRQEYLMRVADRMIEKNLDTEFFREAKTWANDVREIDTAEEQQQWEQYANRVSILIGRDGKVETRDYIKGIFASSINVFPDLDYALDEEVADRLQEDQNRTNVLTSLHEIEAPTLLIGGEFDDIAPREELDFILAELRSELKELEVLEDAGHDLFFDQPELFRRAIREFVGAL